MDKTFYKYKRTEFFHEFPNKSLAIINSGTLLTASLDMEFPFEVNRNFFYFTGIDEPKMKLIMMKVDNVSVDALFIPRVDHTKEKWTGKMLDKDDCKALSGIEKIFYLDELDDYLFTYIGNNKVDKVFLYAQQLRKDGVPTYDNCLLEDVKSLYPFVQIKDLSVLTDSMRAKKDELEVEEIRKAVVITKKAIEKTMLSVKQGMPEYEAQAIFECEVKRRGAGIAFETIVAGGKNATTLHYTKNTAPLKDEDLVLMDCGARVGWYNADVSRTFPVGGKFSDKQRLIYSIVLAANKYLISQAKPGYSCANLNQMLIEFYAQVLYKAGLIKTYEDIYEYYYHGVSHPLGLDTHDVSDRMLPLEPGMIVTIEPGLYFAEFGIGVRIEDDILITEDGCEVLTKDIIKEIDDIEAFMKRNRKVENGK